MRRGEFYTEVDIIDMVRAGNRSLTLGEDDRITDVARERALKEGINITRPPLEAAKRPEYRAPAMSTKTSPSAPNSGARRSDVQERVRQAVRSKLGSGVDPQMLDNVIKRVLDQLGVH
jgi:hypothetical protein